MLSPTISKETCQSIVDKCVSEAQDIAKTSSDEARVVFHQGRAVGAASIGHGINAAMLLVPSPLTMAVNAKVVAWWNKSAGGFYLNKSHIKPMELASHTIVELYERPADLAALVAEIERLNQVVARQEALLASSKIQG